MEFFGFCKSLGTGFGGFPANPGAVVLFVTHLFHKGLAPSTIASKLSALSFVHKLYSFPDPCSHFLVLKCLAGVKKSTNFGDSRLPITREILIQLLPFTWEVTSSHYFSALLKAIMSLSFHAFLRPGEVTGSLHNIPLEAISFSGGSVHIKFTHFKHYQGPPVVIVVPSHQDSACPVRLLLQYLVHRTYFPGPLFCDPDGRPVSYSQFGFWFKSLLSRVGITGKYNLHSFRIGAATWAASRGVSPIMIKKMGRWHSGAYSRYIRLPIVSV